MDTSSYFEGVLLRVPFFTADADGETVAKEIPFFP